MYLYKALCTVDRLQHEGEQIDQVKNTHEAFNLVASQLLACEPAHNSIVQKSTENNYYKSLIADSIKSYWFFLASVLLNSPISDCWDVQLIVPIN